jgi:heme oxygenase
MMYLPEEIEQAFQVELADFEEARKMKYVTTIERMAEARGGKSIILRLLNRRFGEVSPIVLEQVERLSIAQLESLGEALFDFETIADLTAWLENPRA